MKELSFIVLISVVFSSNLRENIFRKEQIKSETKDNFQLDTKKEENKEEDMKILFRPSIKENEQEKEKPERSSRPKKNYKKVQEKKISLPQKREEWEEEEFDDDLMTPKPPRHLRRHRSYIKNKERFHNMEKKGEKKENNEKNQKIFWKADKNDDGGNEERRYQKRGSPQRKIRPMRQSMKEKKRFLDKKRPPIKDNDYYEGKKMTIMRPPEIENLDLEGNYEKWPPFKFEKDKRRPPFRFDNDERSRYFRFDKNKRKPSI